MADEKNKDVVLDEVETVDAVPDMFPKEEQTEPMPEEMMAPEEPVQKEKPAKKEKPKKQKKVKPEKKPKEKKEKKPQKEPEIRKKLMLEEDNPSSKNKEGNILLLLGIFAILFGAGAGVIQFLEILAAMDIYAIGVAAVLLITGILTVVPLSKNVKHGLVIAFFVYYILGILAGPAAWYFLSYGYLEAGLVSGPFVIPFIIAIVYFAKHDKEEPDLIEQMHNSAQIDEKLVLEEDEQPKIKAPRHVRQKKYKESKDVAQKLFKNRIKFTNRFFRSLQSKAKGQIDVLINKDYFEIQKRAKTLLSISEKDYHQQILITVPDSFTNKDDVKYHLEITKDGDNKLYFDQAYVTVLYYGMTSLYIYQCNVDHRSGYIGHDRAQEFKYADVISVETTIKYDNEAHPKYSVLNAELTLINNQKFLIHLRNQRLTDQSAGQPLLSKTEQNVLQKLKDRIRASKV
eukprot:Anaeramoba_ignava/c19853_g1_i1.p1 GENE.c19853_g1_i1~~c19853_g1_i1.p1  ORF type:complete len:457 (+),score=64.67 c19853_g1_i1:1085-2455(+)